MALKRDLLLREQLKGLRQWLSQEAVLVVKKSGDRYRKNPRHINSLKKSGDPFQNPHFSKLASVAHLLEHALGEWMKLFVSSLLASAC